MAFTTHDPILFAEVMLPFFERDIDRTIAAVKAMDMDKDFKIATINELENHREKE